MNKMKIIAGQASKIYKYGGISSIFIMLIGIVESFFSNIQSSVDMKFDIYSVFFGMLKLDSTSTMFSSLIILMLTPLAALIYSVFYYLYSKEKVMLSIALFLLIFLTVEIAYLFI